MKLMSVPVLSQKQVDEGPGLEPGTETVTTDEVTLVFIVDVSASRGRLRVPRPAQNPGGRSRDPPSHTGCGVPEGRARGGPCGTTAAKLVAMQARPYPACLPGLAVAGAAGCGSRRSGLPPSTGRISRRAPAGRGVATSVCAVDGASAAAAVAAAADAPLPPPQVTWQIVVGAVGESTHMLPRFPYRVSRLLAVSSSSSCLTTLTQPALGCPLLQLE